MSPSERRLLRVLAENQSVILSALAQISRDDKSATLLYNMAQLTVDEIKLFDKDSETVTQFDKFVRPRQ